MKESGSARLGMGWEPQHLTSPDVEHVTVLGESGGGPHARPRLPAYCTVQTTVPLQLLFE